MVEWEGHKLHEVRTLNALPRSVQDFLGFHKTGTDAIADRGGKYNRTDVIRPGWPMRCFAVAGLDGDAALIAIEHGGLGWGVEVLLVSDIARTPVVERTWGMSQCPRTLRELIKGVSQHD